MVREAEEWRRWGCGGKKVVKEGLRYLDWVGGPW